MVENSGPFISVIIPAHNEEKYIAKTLSSVFSQNYPLFEIVVVPNGCTDNTQKVVQAAIKGSSAKTKILNVSQKEAHVSKARNKGASIAKGEILVFLDADTLLADNALSTIAKKFTVKRSVGTLHFVPDTKRVQHSLVAAYQNFIHTTKIHKGASGVFICHKNHFEQVGGFNKDLKLFEHKDLQKRLSVFGSYTKLSADAITSMRRYTNRGILKNIAFWVKALGQKENTYEAIR